MYCLVFGYPKLSERGNMLMRQKIMSGSIIILSLVFSLVNVGISQQVDNTQVAQTQTMPPATIDDILVPYKVLEYAQMTYPGHAVTKVKKTIRDGQEVYRLRVDNDSIPDDYESIHLYYSMQWKLLAEEKNAGPEWYLPALNSASIRSYQTNSSSENNGSVTQAQPTTVITSPAPSQPTSNPPAPQTTSPSQTTEETQPPTGNTNTSTEVGGTATPTDSPTN